MLNLAEFKKLELKVALIKEVSDHPNADKLYVMKIDLGGEERQIVAGIKSSYSKEELVGKEVVVLSNLEPALLRGVKSEGMLLATQDEKGISIISPERQVKLGSIVK